MTRRLAWRDQLRFGTGGIDASSSNTQWLQLPAPAEHVSASPARLASASIKAIVGIFIVSSPSLVSPRLGRWRDPRCRFFPRRSSKFVGVYLTFPLLSETPRGLWQRLIGRGGQRSASCLPHWCIAGSARSQRWSDSERVRQGRWGPLERVVTLYRKILGVSHHLHDIHRG